MPKTTSAQQQEDFLNAYVATRGNIQQSCARAGIDRRTFYNWKKDPIFLEKLVAFVEQSEDKIVDDITLALYNDFMWEAQIRGKIQAGDSKLKKGMKDEAFHNLGFRLLSLTKKGKAMLGITPPEIQQTKDPFSEVFVLAMGDPNKQVARNNGIHHISGKIEPNLEQPTNDNDAG